jgi:hypothetical protein
MKSGIKLIKTLGATALVLGLVAGCGDTKEDTAMPLDKKVNETVVTVDGVPGGVAIRTVKMQAKVASIDYEKRSVSLEDDKGHRKTITVGPEAINFDQITAGDSVSIEFMEEQVVYLNGVEEHAEQGAAVVAAKTPEGEMPGGVVAEMVEIVATVTAVDLENHTATLTFSNGASEVHQVRPDVELLESHVGREVVIQRTVAMAIAVEKM